MNVVAVVVLSDGNVLSLDGVWGFVLSMPMMVVVVAAVDDVVVYGAVPVPVPFPSWRALTLTLLLLLVLLLVLAFMPMRCVRSSDRDTEPLRVVSAA